MLTTDQSLKRLFSRRAWHKNSGINESTARVCKKRYFENRLEIETQMKILEACGFRLIKVMQWEEQLDCDMLKMKLIDRLKDENTFWSFDRTPDADVPDEVLIEKTLLYLDIKDINNLFSLFSEEKIRKIWKDRMLSQEPMYHQLNRLYAFLYFNIKDPDRYIRDYIYKKHRLIQCRD